MKTRSFIIFAIFVGLLSQPLFIFGQTTSSGDWASVKSLTSGSKLSVKTKDGKRFEGKLDSVTDTAISITNKGKTETVEASTVKTIYEIVGKSRASSIGIGAGIGAGAGAGVGLLLLGVTGGSDNAGAVVAPFILGGAALGAALGAAFSRKKRTLIYQSN